MKIGILGVNKVSKFYAIILSQYNHNVIMYQSESPINNFAVEKIILEKNFYETYIKDLKIFKCLNIEDIEFEVTEKFLIKENKVKENFVYLKSYEYIEGFNFEKIPNIEISPLNSASINQIKMMEDILIIDTPNPDILKQLDLIKLNGWTSLYMQAEVSEEKNFQITKEGQYSIFAVQEKDYLEIFINSKQRNKSQIMKILNKKVKNIKILDEQEIQKYDSYAYKNMAIINTALVETNNPYRDYSLLVQIIQNTDCKKIYSNLDIYSDIKSQVI